MALRKPQHGAQRTSVPGSPSVELEHELVRIAPEPVLTRLEGLDHRVGRRAVVLRGVLVLRAVTAADVAAGHAEAEVDPDVADLQALLAALAAGGDVEVDLVQMRAGVGHQPRYPSTVSGSRSVAPSGSRPALRRARRWWRRSHAWSRVTSMLRSRSRSSGVTLPSDSRSKRRCSSLARALMWSMICWSSLPAPSWRGPDGGLRRRPPTGNPTRSVRGGIVPSLSYRLPRLPCRAGTS